MKKLFVLSLAAIISANISLGQEKKCPMMGGKQGSCGMAGMNKPGGRKGVMQQLNLSDQQKTGMKALREEKQTKLADLESNDKITMADYRSRREAINKEYRGKMENLLTPDQKNRMAEMKKSRTEDREKQMESRLAKMKENLSLSNDQEKLLRDQMNTMKTKLQSIRQNSSLGPDQKKLQIRQAREEGKKQLEAILTPDQLSKFRANQEKRRDMMKKHHQQDMGN